MPTKSSGTHERCKGATRPARTRRLPAQPPKEKARSPRTAESDGALGANLQAFRRRLSAIGETLSALLVGMETSDSDLWGSGLYLQFVNKLYQALDDNDLTLKDLQVLSKIIMEQRRTQLHALQVERRTRTAPRRPSADTARRRSTDPPTPSTAPEAPSQLGTLVRDVYGLQLSGEPTPRHARGIED